MTLKIEISGAILNFGRIIPMWHIVAEAFNCWR
jgi:hypothetical protein